MKVLVACEYSGVVRDAFIRRGHDAMSCDLLASEKPGPHYKGNVLDILDHGWDLMIAHPPCKHLASSGARWWAAKRASRQQHWVQLSDTLGVQHVPEQAAALDFVRRLMSCNIRRICIENPVSVISTHIRKPDQIIQPWHFGHARKKTTCLWLKHLPLLIPTNTMLNPKDWITGVPDTRRQWKIRSRTFQGIADAMAEQWTG